MGPIPINPWEVADNSVAFLFSLFTTAALTYLVWKVMNSFLDLFVGKGMAFLGAVFSAVLVMSAGLQVSVSFLESARTIYILQGLIAGIVRTINACIAPRWMNPLEFLIFVSFGLYICYWLHTRFAPKHTADDLRRKIDRALEDNSSKEKSYPY
ncbi:MAG: hypothetical protein HY811_02605 [Planctomycetes bacterium]|nr:hypothetical protein [Planctomycetota bacterium]